MIRRQRHSSGSWFRGIAAALHVSAGILMFTVPAGPANAANPDAPAVFTVTQTIVRDDVEPVGVNLTKLTGGTNLATNNFIYGGGMEPAEKRFLVRIEDFGPGWMSWEESLGGVHMYEQNATGFGDGAVVRLYRIVDETGQPLSYNNGTSLNDNTGADHVIFLGETNVPDGGWVAEGTEPGAINRVMLADTSLSPAYGDHAIITVKKYKLDEAEVHPRLHQWFQANNGILRHQGGTTNYDSELVQHPGTIPPDFADPGETCLQVTVNDPAELRIGQYLFHAHDDGEGRWYSQLEPGAPYRAEVWLRQQGLPESAVRFQSPGPYAGISQSTPWQVTGQWQRFTYDFTGPAYPPVGTFHAGFGLAIEGPGTVWIDNFVVYRNDAEHEFRPYTPHTVAFNEMMSAMPEEGPKPALRFFTETYYDHAAMDRLLSNQPSSRLDFIYNVQGGSQLMTIPIAMEWCLKTGADAHSRAVPYITLSEEYTELEWTMLAEYLGVPYDPATDSPLEKPWAHRRYQHRGHGTPWTDEFREIIIEFGNETWHAGVFAGWDGFGRFGWVHHGGTEYGLFAEYYFAQHVMSQPWWDQHDLGQKIRFALNGNYDADPQNAYGELAAQAAPTATSYLGHANYVGPTWETGDTPFDVFDDHGMQETLCGAYLGMYPLIAAVSEARDQLAQQGVVAYRPIAYEGGPSGYYLPGNGTDDQVAISQLFGKSAGMAVASLDVWLYASLNGYGHQCFYAYGCGSNWTSHTMPRAGGFRRHPSWLALMMRNRFAPGKIMLDVTAEQVPTYERSGEDVPLTTAYALRDDDAWSVFVLSRKLDGNHDGVDFGDGSTPVTINLPFANCTALTRYTLTTPAGNPIDPRANNLDTENVVIDELSLDPSLIEGGQLVIDELSGGVSGGMPPGSIYLYRFDTGVEPKPVPAASAWGALVFVLIALGIVSCLIRVHSATNTAWFTRG